MFNYLSNIQKFPDHVDLNDVELFAKYKRLFESPSLVVEGLLVPNLNNEGNLCAIYFPDEHNDTVLSIVDPWIKVNERNIALGQMENLSMMNLFLLAPDSDFRISFESFLLKNIRPVGVNYYGQREKAIAVIDFIGDYIPSKHMEVQSLSEVYLHQFRDLKKMVGITDKPG